MNEKLLTILRCPVTMKPLAMADDEVLHDLNTRIQVGKVNTKEGETVTEVFTEGLITTDKKIFYPIRSGVPVLLESESILLSDQVD
ncbi:MAG: Trm112 family protein [Fidelibacterota bacterium]